MMADRQDSVTRASEAAVALRRELHRHPELSWREVETTKKIAARMAELGVSVVKKGFKVYNLDKGFDNWKELGKEIEQ